MDDNASNLYIIISHTLSIFALLCLIIITTCILSFPIKGMRKYYRNLLIIYNFTSLLGAVYVSSGALPTFLLPCAAYYFNGYLKSIGVSPFTQLILLALTIMDTASILLIILVARALVVLNIKDKYKSVVLKGVVIHAFIYNCVGVIIAETCFSLEGDKTKKCVEALDLPEKADALAEETFLCLDVKGSYHTVIIIIFSVWIIASQGAFAVILLSKMILRTLLPNAFNLSARTVETQRQITLMTISVFIIQATFFVIPGTILVASLVFGLALPPVFSDIAFTSLTAALITGPVTLLLATRKYRIGIKKVLTYSSYMT